MGADVVTPILTAAAIRARLGRRRRGPRLRFQGATSDSVVAFLRECGYTIYNFSPSSGCLAASDAGPYTDNIVASHGELDRRYLEHSMLM